MKNSPTFKAPESKECWGYIRVSTDDQDNSIETQSAQIRAYCEKQSLTLLGVTIDEDSSATEVYFFDRPKVQVMLREEMPAAGCKRIIVTKIDRGFRNTMDGLFSMEELLKDGIRVSLLDFPFDTSTPVGELLFTNMLSYARFESRRRKERQAETIITMKAANLLTGKLRYGWDKVVSAERKTKNPERSAETRELAGDMAFNVFPNWKEQYWLRKICIEWKDETACECARRLNREGVTAKNGGKWFPSTIDSVRKHAVIADESTRPKILVESLLEAEKLQQLGINAIAVPAKAA